MTPALQSRGAGVLFFIIKLYDWFKKNVVMSHR